MDIDELIRESDPARTEGMPGTWDERWARQMAHLDRSHRRRTTRRQLAVAVPLGLVVALLAALLPQWLASRPSAAAVLDAAATAATAQAPLVPAPGQYLYSVTHSEFELDAGRPFDVPPVPGSPAVATATWTETKQIWVDTTGTGRSVITASPYHFSSATDEAAWHRYMTLPTLPPVTTSTTVGSATTDVAALPTDPATLAAEIADGRTGTTIDRMRFSHDNTFLGAASLLVSQARGMTPALQGALFRVMAAQPGAAVETGITGASGARGTAVSVGGAIGATSSQFEGIIVDPRTGAPLEVDFAPPSTLMRQTPGAACTRATGGPCATADFSQGPRWTALTAPVIVGSDVSTVPVGG